MSAVANEHDPMDCHLRFNNGKVRTEQTVHSIADFVFKKL